MKTLGDEFVTVVHFSHLKPEGFRKSRHTFQRDRGEYAEHYQVQGSAWNSRSEPWTCYLNSGISFRGFPRRTPDGEFPRTHAWMRAGLFVPGARAQYDVTRLALTGVAAELADVIAKCSKYFERRHLALRHAYENQLYVRGFLADPELQGNT
jgi:hypothetical protein